MADHQLPVFLECISETCRFRFPALTYKELIASNICPSCGSPTILSGIRPTSRTISRPNHYNFAPQMVEVLADNIRSAYNVGSLFRISDGAGIHHIHLCGLTPTPPNHSILKTALGAENNVAWTYHKNAKLTAIKHQQLGYHLWALETGEDSNSIFEINYPPKNEPIMLILGNEVCGIDPEILPLCEKHLCIPMLGIKESLNVSSAFGVAAYTICFHLHHSFEISS